MALISHNQVQDSYCILGLDEEGDNQQGRTLTVGLVRETWM